MKVIIKWDAIKIDCIPFFFFKKVCYNFIVKKYTKNINKKIKWKQKKRCKNVAGEK